MRVPIFSPHGYSSHAKRAFGSGYCVYAPTPEHFGMLLSGVGEDALLRPGAGPPTSADANDVALLDAAVLASALSAPSGFVTIRRFQAVAGRDAASTGGTAAWTPVSPRGGGVAGGDSPSACAVAASGRFASSPAAAAAMTPTITCRLGSTCWCREPSHAEPAADARLRQYFREAVVVPLATMRLLGVEEGALVQLSFHSEETVLAASTVVFALVSDGVGEELSFDSYMRHFVAPFFIQRRRAVSVGEEFEIRNHDQGRLHVTAVALNDGLLKCGIVADDTHVRLVVQPAAPPQLQGREGSSASESPTPRPRARSAGSGRSLGREASESHAVLGRPPRVHAPTLPRATRSAEPHGGPASFPMYAPQTLELREARLAHRKRPPTACTGAKSVGAAAESVADADPASNAYDATTTTAAAAFVAAAGDAVDTANVASTEAATFPLKDMPSGTREVGTQCDEARAFGVEEPGGSGGNDATEPVPYDYNAAEGTPMQETGAQSEPHSVCVSNVVPYHCDLAENAETRPKQLPALPRDAACRAHRIVESWLAVKAQWQQLSISPLLKRESYAAIKEFQHFLAVYKELRQRHADCLAYLDSPYGHTVRGDLVLRVSLLPTAAKLEGGSGGAVEPPWRRSETHSASGAADDEDAQSTRTAGASGGSETVALAAELLRLSLRELSAALRRDVLHVFRVGGTCPALYCTLMTPCNDGPGEVTLLGAPCPVEVLRTTILEDLCEAREESRREWLQLAAQWKEAVSGVLQLGVFTTQLQTVRQLFLELARLLHYPGEVQRSASYRRRVFPHPPGGGSEDITAAMPTAKGLAPSVPCEGFLPYLQELQDAYYLFVELLEPFVLHSLQQLRTISALTDAMRCSQLVEFLRVSYQAQMAGQRTGVEAERAAFVALVEARRAGALMPLPTEWWEADGAGGKLKVSA
ncbi:uncharacterized protein Tco025E_06895 [Trypanosoma conorhini]|uniref:Uncharacterized protein n=1 Tax=Trypanosoma conorhini TaxID=83891 RepID=A0A3R7NQD9_9TRYP|nr:uncharacterized protein Tco025E_06895 [Trypanosoma conorhini]RNF09956.1 hypothetical protein Tco025E_06895 [Trypanosoma conorhini]